MKNTKKLTSHLRYSKEKEQEQYKTIIKKDVLFLELEIKL